MTAVVFRVGELVCALPIEHVGEVMRLRPLTRVDDMPPLVSGLAVIRGSNVPVIDLAGLLEVEGAPARLVTVRAGDRFVALAVDEVVGLRRFDRATFDARPPLLRTDAAPLVELVAVKDRAAYLVLNAARVVSDGHGGS